METDKVAFERTIAQANGFSCWCGTDEVGRGSLAGPVYAAAVYLGDAHIEGLDDSKKLTARRRRELFDEICAKTVWSVRFVTVREINRTDILSASQKAMRDAVDDVASLVPIDGVIVDGNVAREFTLPVVSVVGGDEKCASVAAASIVAKVVRDRVLTDMDEFFPGYGFAKNKGYGTKEHYEGLNRFGPSVEHRTRFLRKYYYRRDRMEAKRRGMLGEQIALKEYTKRRYVLKERNFRTRRGEIDLIVANNKYIVFCEVKLRGSVDFAQPVEFVDIHKQRRIRMAAQEWLQRNPCNLQPRFDVIGIVDEDKDNPKIELIENAF